MDALRERCRKGGADAFQKFMKEEPLIVVRLIDLACGKEVMDLALLKAVEEGRIDLDDLLKKKSH